MPQIQQPAVADRIEAEQHNRETLAPWWRKADILPAYPACLETVVDLLTDAEYDVTRDLLLQYINDKVVPSPDRQNGRLIFMATDIVALVTVLESRRRWKPFSRFHDHKKNQFEKLTELAQLNGQSSCFHDLDKWDIGGLLALLQSEGCDIGARCAITVALKQKLKAKGIEV